MAKLITKIKETLAKPKVVREPILIPTGSTMLNLACSDHIDGGYATGKIVNVIGDSSAGKCVKNAYILTNNGMELIDNIGKEKIFGATEYINTLATSKSIEDDTSHFWKEKVGKTIKIQTRHGYSIEGTSDHPIMVFTKDFEFKMKKLKDIELNDLAIIAKGTNKFNNKLIKIPIITNLDINAKVANIPEYINESFARLLGYIVADGNLSKGHVQISNTKKYIRNDLKDICDSLNLYLGQSSISSVHLQLVISKIFNDPIKFTARNKFVPDCILNSPKAIQASFLRALIDCDSWGDGSCIEYYTASKVLAQQVHLMLLNFGIVSNLKSQNSAKVGNKIYNHTYWKIVFYSDDLKVYGKEIGSLKYIIDNLSEYRKSDFDRIPIIQKMKKDIDNLRKKLGWSKNGKCTYYKERFPRFKFSNSTGSIYVIKKFINTFVNMPIDLSFYKYILNSGYHFDPIVKITNIEKETVVYDVHIPNTHLFWSNGFINHNTILALSTFAEITSNPKFKDFHLIFDDVENALEFDISYLFGIETENRVSYSIKSNSIEEFYGNVLNVIDKGEPFVYVLDSFDALTSNEDKGRADEYAKGKEVGGSYKTEKARMTSEILRTIKADLKNVDGLVIVISQTRDNLTPMAFGSKKKRSGGQALKFYSCHEIWLAVQSRELKRKVEIGTNVVAKVSKNKLTGKLRKAYFPVFYDYGIDDISSCINFLVDEDYWKKKGTKIDAQELSIEGMRSTIVNHIEETDGAYDTLRNLVQKVWDDKEESLKLNRKRRYE